MFNSLIGSHHCTGGWLSRRKAGGQRERVQMARENDEVHESIKINLLFKCFTNHLYVVTSNVGSW